MLPTMEETVEIHGCYVKKRSEKPLLSSDLHSKTDDRQTAGRHPVEALMLDLLSLCAA